MILKENSYKIAIETNGTIIPPKNIDWVCVSPKANTKIVIKKGDELKLVYPQENIQPSDFLNYKFTYFYLQPMDNKNRLKNTKLAIDYCLKNPRWKLSLQTHKIINIK